MARARTGKSRANRRYLPGNLDWLARMALLEG